MKIIISALRRSGSTVFWRSFRDCSNAICFDEPFNPRLINLPRDHPKVVCAEYISLLEQDSTAFWNHFAPIYSLDELSARFSAEQESYITWLLGRDQDVVIDTTRCWNKIKDLSAACGPDAFFIHLHRSPAAFTASHLLPSDLNGSLLGKLHLYKRKQQFFKTMRNFNTWQIEEILGSGPGSAFAARFLDASTTHPFYRMTACQRLLYFWNIVYNKVEAEGRAEFGDRFMSVEFEAFSRNPATILRRITKLTGLKMDPARLVNVKPAGRVLRHGDPRWTDAARNAGLPTEGDFLFRA